MEETITVTGETPVVDVQSAKRQQTLSTEMLTSIPTARASNAILTLIPSMVTSGGGNNNVQLQPGMIVFGGRGGRGNEGRLQLDGLNTGASVNGGGVSGYTADVQNAAEIAMAPSGGLGENEVGGPAMNIVPRTGGNTFKFYTYASFTGDKLQGSNFTPELQAAGLRAPGAINRLWDVSGSGGGPIVKDRSGSSRRCATAATTPTSSACTTTRTPATSPSGPTRRTPAGRRSASRTRRSSRWRG